MRATKSAPSSFLIYRFGPYEVDLGRNELRKFGVPIRLERKPWQVLLTLLARRGELVARAELQAWLWGDKVFVDFETGLNVAVKKVRAALSDSAEAPKYIETVTGEGYRFIAEVEQVPATPPLAAANGGHGAVPGPTLVTASPWMPLPGSGARRSPLGKPAMAACASLLVIAAALLWHRVTPPTTVPEGKIKLVVLPLENLSGDSTQNYLSDGMTEELSERLGNLNPERLSVVGRTSAMTYKHLQRTVSQIGNELGVGYVLEGSVRRTGNRLRVTAQLVEVRGQTLVWARDYDGDLHDLLEVEDEIAGDIAQQVGVSIAVVVPEKSLRPHRPNAEAHEAYLLGRYYWFKRTPEAGQTATAYFRRAIKKDPQYAAAYAGLAESSLPRDQALAVASKAVELDPASGEARMALGWVLLYRELDIHGAEDALKAATQMDPSYAPAHHTYSELLAMTGRLPEAISEKKQALRLDPLFEICRASLAEALALEGQFEQAQAQINLILAMDPEYPKAHESMGRIYLRMGKYEEAIREFKLSHQYGGDEDRADLGYAYARSGNRQEALRLVSELQSLEKNDPAAAFDSVVVELGLGNNDQAIAVLEKLYQKHVDDDGLLELKCDPTFAPLRPDPRFEELIRRIKFPS